MKFKVEETTTGGLGTVALFFDYCVLRIVHVVIFIYSSIGLTGFTDVSTYLRTHDFHLISNCSVTHTFFIMQGSGRSCLFAEVTSFSDNL